MHERALMPMRGQPGAYLASAGASRRQFTAGTLLCTAWPVRAGDPWLVTLRAPDGPGDLRNAYVRDAVELALKRTQASHGPARTALSPPMNKRRALRVASQQELKNFVLAASPESVAGLGLAPVPFPIHLGVNGYRVCFVSQSARAAARQATDLEDLRRFKHVQGLGWADVGILRRNGFEVVEAITYQALFAMLARGRADLLCRSVLEVGAEVSAHARDAGLVLDDSFALSYELPQYLYTHAANTALIQRLHQGLEQSFDDGSLQA